MNEFAQMLFMLAAGHALADYPLQGPAMAAAKRPGGDPCVPWPMALGCHSLIHGGFVALITGLWWLGAAETLAHAAIDAAKCRGTIGMTADQALHLACKLVWALIAWSVWYG
jgi:hypothetical protein